MYEITSEFNGSIDYAATGVKAILQNASFLLSTYIGTCPLDRTAGWEPPIDDPTPIAQVKSTAQIIEMLERSIPELKVQSVNFEQNSEGKLVARVKVEINDD
ncbi:hypothetical protein NST81_02965 [Bacillus sp. FSL W8-0223]|uniref:hypothetical protein n=1 Tax=Bacillus sp. FSL W8-0223 TaxID=2954595 RepID=UPI0030F661CD